MQPAYAIYLLESRWTYDHSNTEIATITVEGREGQRWQMELEDLLKPELNANIKKMTIKELREIAQNQCGTQSGICRLIRLYRVVDHEGLTVNSPLTVELEGGRKTASVSLKLKPICDFDENDRILPIDVGGF